MGAVKTNRQLYIESLGMNGQLCKFKKRIKMEKKIFQERNMPYFGGEFNNRRKMAGLPLIRRVSS